MRAGPAALFALWAALTAAAPAANLAGTWDLIWQTRRGPQQRGYLVVEQAGSALRAEIHGQGQVRARGTAAGAAFRLRGSRLAVPYRIEGRLNGARLEGTLKILHIERRFTGVRRPR